jgi:hypothetical protein
VTTNVEAMPVLLSQRAAPRDLDAFADLVGSARWGRRLAEIRDRAAGGPRAGQAIRQRHAIELTIERLRHPSRPPTSPEAMIAGFAAATVRLSRSLSRAGLERLRASLAEATVGSATLVGLFHQVRTALLHESRGFAVTHAGLEDGASFDLLLTRDGMRAEVACDVVSAEEGRGVHRGAWFRLADRVDPDLQTWLAEHPGRYLLKMTLPAGLRGGLAESDTETTVLATLHARIRAMLVSRVRQDHDEAIVLRLDPLLLAGAQAAELGLMTSLRQEFGPEANLAVTTARNSVFVMAARAGQENDIAAAMRRRMAAVAPARLSGERPGILSMFVEDTDRDEWRGLRDRLELEGEARRFLTDPEARSVVAVSFVSRMELFGAREPDAAPEGEIRFRNPGHPAAKVAALAPSVVSSE